MFLTLWKSNSFSSSENLSKESLSTDNSSKVNRSRINHDLKHIFIDFFLSSSGIAILLVSSLRLPSRMFIEQSIAADARIISSNFSSLNLLFVRCSFSSESSTNIVEADKRNKISRPLSNRSFRISHLSKSDHDSCCFWEPWSSKVWIADRMSLVVLKWRRTTSRWITMWHLN